MISSASLENAKDIQLNIKELLTPLNESIEKLKSLEKNARVSKAFQDENYQISNDLIAQVENRLEKFEHPNILLSTPQDFVSVSQKTKLMLLKKI